MPARCALYNFIEMSLFALTVDGALPTFDVLCPQRKRNRTGSVHADINNTKLLPFVGVCVCECVTLVLIRCREGEASIGS